MPKATVDPRTHRFDLKTCPGGYVILRTLSFDEMELRKDIAGRMYQEDRVANLRKKGKRDNEDLIRLNFEAANVKVTEYEFHNCIVEHNLYVDDAETQLIDFSKPMKYWLLDPKIGEEISGYIAELTQIDEDDVGPLPTPLSSFSSDETTDPENSLVTN